MEVQNEESSKIYQDPEIGNTYKATTGRAITFYFSFISIYAAFILSTECCISKVRPTQKNSELTSLECQDLLGSSMKVNRGFAPSDMK